MEAVAFPLMLAWIFLLFRMAIRGEKHGIYVTRRNVIRAGGVGVLAGLAWVLVEPSDNLLANIGKVFWLVLATAFLFFEAGDEPPEKIREREEEWTMELPDKTIGRLQFIGLAGTVVAEFFLGVLYALFWEEWSPDARVAWWVAFVIVGLMVVIPLAILWTRRRPRSPEPPDTRPKT